MARILVADDDPLMRAIVSEALLQGEHEVREAVDGLDALDQCSREVFDLVITDMLMPGMDGIELIRALNERRPGLPIIAISSGGRFGSDDVLRWGRAVGADAIMAKPLRGEALRATVQRLLNAAPDQGSGRGSGGASPPGA